MVAFQRPDGHLQAVAPLTIAAGLSDRRWELCRDFNGRSPVQDGGIKRRWRHQELLPPRSAAQRGPVSGGARRAAGAAASYALHTFIAWLIHVVVWSETRQTRCNAAATATAPGMQRPCTPLCSRLQRQQFGAISYTNHDQPDASLQGFFSAGGGRAGAAPMPRHSRSLCPRCLRCRSAAAAEGQQAAIAACSCCTSGGVTRHLAAAPLVCRMSSPVS